MKGPKKGNHSAKRIEAQSDTKTGEPNGKNRNWESTPKTFTEPDRYRGIRGGKKVVGMTWLLGRQLPGWQKGNSKNEREGSVGQGGRKKVISEWSMYRQPNCGLKTGQKKN